MKGTAVNHEDYHFMGIQLDMSKLQPQKMHYRNFGNSGLKVSALSLGNMTNFKPETYEEDKAIVAACLKNGINYFDTAELYSSGEAETQLGKILHDLQVDRKQIIIATKIHTSKDPEINSSRVLSRKHIREGLEQSLQRLQIDYVDLIYAHFEEETTPLEEVCRAFHQTIEDGQAFYWATSNWDPETVFKALGLCQTLNLHKPIGTQEQYSLFSRSVPQVDLQHLFDHYSYGLVVYAPLAGGLLTDRFLNGISPKDLEPRTSSFPQGLLEAFNEDPSCVEKTVSKLKKLSEVAQSMGFRLCHLALAWVLKYGHVDSVVVGARSVLQLEDTLRALELFSKWSPELQVQVNKLIDTSPAPRMNFMKWVPYPPARPVSL